MHTMPLPAHAPDQHRRERCLHVGTHASCRRDMHSDDDDDYDADPCQMMMMRIIAHSHSFTSNLS